MDCEKIRSKLLSTESEEEFICLLNCISKWIPNKSMIEFTKEDIEAIRKSKDDYYHSFYDNRKRKKRKITAPNEKLKTIQSCIKIALESVYNPPPWVHGYVFGKNVKSNAKAHQNRRYLLTLDLKEFYPSISPLRIRNSLTSEKLGIKTQVASLITDLCCYGDQLTTGSPCSPVISNIVCLQMDNKLHNYCNIREITCTRYADDLPFSSDRLPDRFIWNIKRIILEEGFFLNRKKEKFQKSNSGQFVTNIFVSGNRLKTRLKYRQEVRAMLHNWKNCGKDFCQRKYVKYAKGKKNPDFINSLYGRIQYIGSIHGHDSILYKTFLKEFQRLKRYKS
jgi:RNA-directed DNA polymerase